MGKKTFYTERDIEEIAARGVKSLEIGPDDYVTDLARDRAGRLGVMLVREHDTPASAPERPYIAKATRPAVKASQPAPEKDELHARVRAAVIRRLGEDLDAGLLDTIIRRVLQNISTTG